jgi:hypothetical protein
MLRQSVSPKCCAVLFAAVSWLGCSPSDVLDGNPAATRAAIGPSLNTEEQPPIIELELDAEVFVSDAFGTPGAPGSTYQYHMTLAFDSTDIRVESEFSPTSLPELDPSEPVRVSTSVFDTFGEQLSVGLADGSSASAPVSMDGGSSFEALAGPSPDGLTPSAETGARSVRAFRGALRKSDYSRVLSGIANRVSLDPSTLPKRVNDSNDAALERSAVEFDDNSIDSTWIDRRTWMLVREVYTKGGDRTAIRHEYSQITPGFFVRTATTFELTAGAQTQTVRRRFTNVVLHSRGR